MYTSKNYRRLFCVRLVTVFLDVLFMVVYWYGITFPGTKASMCYGAYVIDYVDLQDTPYLWPLYLIKKITNIVSLKVFILRKLCLVL